MKKSLVVKTLSWNTFINLSQGSNSSPPKLPLTGDFGSASQQSSSICSQANAVAAVGRVITAICAIGGRVAAAIRGQQKLSPLSSSSFSSLLTGLTAPAASTQGVSAALSIGIGDCCQQHQQQQLAVLLPVPAAVSRGSSGNNPGIK
uniref:Uncharacterized protein n=1 Tax=Ananas comosus var. bracteatus TaxID=296719 RepID=A0A6V7P220_ANACO|nr:unnamed protein product [Ananas comosus var. bracteatus]